MTKGVSSREGLPVAVAGDGATVRRADGSKLLDFESGGFGHGAGQVVAAVAEQMAVNPLATRHFLSLPLARFATRLANVCPGELEVSYFCNSGAEAVEGALKLARGFHPDRPGFVGLLGGYHGSTLGALSVCGIEQMRAPFSQLPLQAGFAAQPDGLAELIDRRTAAVIVEPWPGAAGPRRAKSGWLRRLAGRCAETRTLLIADETRTGMGHTGAMFAVEHEGVVPDILVVGGALGGGVLPVAGYVADRRVNARVYGRRDPTLHASATGGNPAACAAGMATLRTIEGEGLVDGARAKGRLLCAGLEALAARHRGAVAACRALGLFAWLEFHDGGAAAVVERAAFERGLAIRRAPAGEESAGIELCPPLLVEAEEIRRALEILDDAVAAARQAVAG